MLQPVETPKAVEIAPTTEVTNISANNTPARLREYDKASETCKVRSKIVLNTVNDKHEPDYDIKKIKITRDGLKLAQKEADYIMSHKSEFSDIKTPQEFVEKYSEYCRGNNGGFAFQK